MVCYCCSVFVLVCVFVARVWVVCDSLCHRVWFLCVVVCLSSCVLCWMCLGVLFVIYCV